MLGESLQGDTEAIRQGVERGELQLHNWGEFVAITEQQGAEFVVCCAAGRNLGRYLPRLYQLAQQRSSSIRFHSHRPGIARMAALYKFKPIGTDAHGQTIYRAGV